MLTHLRSYDGAVPRFYDSDKNSWLHHIFMTILGDSAMCLISIDTFIEKADGMLDFGHA